MQYHPVLQPQLRPQSLTTAQQHLQTGHSAGPFSLSDRNGRASRAGPGNRRCSIVVLYSVVNNLPQTLCSFGSLFFHSSCISRFCQHLDKENAARSLPAKEKRDSYRSAPLRWSWIIIVILDRSKIYSTFDLNWFGWAGFCLRIKKRLFVQTLLTRFSMSRHSCVTYTFNIWFPLKCSAPYSKPCCVCF